MARLASDCQRYPSALSDLGQSRPSVSHASIKLAQPPFPTQLTFNGPLAELLNVESARNVALLRPAPEGMPFSCTFLSAHDSENRSFLLAQRK